MNAATTFQRTPLLITAGNLTAGPVHATYRSGDRESLLHNYLVLVRQMRGQQREPSITLRNADITALAEHLGTSEERILDDLLDRMGATRAQRKALLAMFAIGALSIVATGSVALELAPAGALAQSATDSPAAVVTSPVATAAVADVVDRPAVSDAPASSEVAAPAVAVAPSAVPSAELAIATGGADWEYTLSLHQLVHALSSPSAADLGVPTEGVGVADDGSVVAVAAPPVPSAEGVGVADDGSVVAVAAPPVPSAEGVGVADDGSVVAVAPPPVP
jgi:hypothetical protein